MELRLDRQWNGSAAPGGLGGLVTVQSQGARFCWSWELALAASPSVPAAPVGLVDGLWEHDVVELFLVDSRGPDDHYLELEVGPSGHWLGLELRGVRQRVRLLEDARPRIDTKVSDGLWRGRLELDLSYVREIVGITPWRGLAAAVLGTEIANDRAFLTSSVLPSERPDFHQPRAFGVIAA
jgi:hypothetical protein